MNRNQYDDVDTANSNDFNSELKTSPYYDENMLFTALEGKQGNFSILSSNIQSVFTTFDELRSYVVDLKNGMNFEFSIITLQECFFPQGGILTSELMLPGYRCYAQPRSYGRNGGLLTYILEKFNVVEKSIPIEHRKLLECQFLEVSGGGLRKTFIVGNIYRPPREHSVDIANFLSGFAKVLDQTVRPNKELVLCGDFNLDLLKIDSAPHIHDFYSLLSSFGFYAKITLPTRFSDHGASLIDNLFCRQSILTTRTLSGILLKKFSDHQPYFSVFENLTDDLKCCPPKYIMTYGKLDAVKLAEKLNTIDIKNKLVSNDPNVNTEILINIVNECKDQLAPKKLVKFRRHKHKRNPWMTTGILSSIKSRDKMYKELLHLPLESEERKKLKINIHTYNRIIRRSIRIAKVDYYRDLFDNCKNDSRETWKNINAFLKPASSNRPSEYFMVEGEKISDKCKIAENFNTFFASIGHSYANALNSSNFGFQKYFENAPANEDSLYFEHVSGADVEKIIDELKPKFSSGIDGISTKLLKDLKHIISEPISVIINQCFESGIFPQFLKIAKVIPLFKKGETFMFSNYRPISLLPSVSKIFEKIIFKQLYNFLDRQNLLFRSQYGFRQKYSTELAALELFDRIYEETQKGNVPLAIFLDLSKAFDTLDHQVLLWKLEHYGIRNRSLQLLKSYLSDRRQYVEFDGVKSSNLPLTIGVPQGSILGPLFFIIYMNDIVNSSNLLEFIIYADDTSILTTPTLVNVDKRHENSITSELGKVNSWLTENRLSLNLDKTKCMIFHNVRKRNAYKPTLSIKDVEIEYVDTFKFLGFIIDMNMNWKAHANYISKKLLSGIGILGRLKSLFPLDIKLKIYFALVNCHLTSGLLLWGHRFNDVFKLQKKAIRLVMSSKYNAHTNPFFKSLKILKVEDMYKLSCIKFYHKYVSQNLPPYHLELPLKQNCDEHEHFTRKSTKIHITHCRPISSLRRSIPSCINSLPDAVGSKLLHTQYRYGLNFIANLFKKNCFSVYSTECSEPECYICQSSRSN